MFKSVAFGFIILILFFGLIISCTISEDEANPTLDEATVSEKADAYKAEQEKEALEKEAVAKAEAEIKAEEEAELRKKQESAQSEKEQTFLSEMDMYLGEMFEVSFDEETKTFSSIPTIPGFMEELVMISQGQMPMTNWTELVDSTVVVSERIQMELGDGYSFEMLNPNNLERVLILTKDGQLIYEAMEQGEAI